MRLKVILALILVVMLIGTGIVDAKTSKSGGKVGGSSKSFSTSQKGSSVKDGIPMAAAGAVAVSGLSNKAKKPHIDDDIFENETEEAQEAEQSPGFGALPTLMGISLWVLSKRFRKLGQ